MAALRHIVVVGAGVAGLASSIACAAAGARVDLFEVRVAAPPLPAHVDIVPNLLRDLARLGVADACVREGFAYNGLAVVDEHGTRHFDLPTPRLAGERLPRALGITYDRLLAALDDAARRAGVQMHFGRGVLAVDPHNAAVALNDGTQRGADLIVLATGAGAPLVRQLFDVSGAGDASHGWWYALMPRPHGLDQATLMIGARGRRLLLVPTGMAEAGIAILRSRDLDHGTEGAPMAAILSAWGEFPRRLAALLPAHAATVVRANDRALLAPRTASCRRSASRVRRSSKTPSCSAN
jgi:2-polyprenyl-6-methoxyphenol hydroxylase-like FAD-dependent oxidoreductase